MNNYRYEQGLINEADMPADVAQAKRHFDFAIAFTPSDFSQPLTTFGDTFVRLVLLPYFGGCDISSMAKQTH